MKIGFQKLGPKIINYRNYKYFDNEDFRKDFRKDLLVELSKYNLHNIDCTEFENLFMRTLNKHAPLIKKVH